MPPCAQSFLNISLARGAHGIQGSWFPMGYQGHRVMDQLEAAAHGDFEDRDQRWLGREELRKRCLIDLATEENLRNLAIGECLRLSEGQLVFAVPELKNLLSEPQVELSMGHVLG